MLPGTKEAYIGTLFSPAGLELETGLLMPGAGEGLTKKPANRNIAGKSRAKKPKLKKSPTRKNKALKSKKKTAKKAGRTIKAKKAKKTKKKR